MYEDDYALPLITNGTHNLVPLPDNVTFAQGAYGHLAATAVVIEEANQGLANLRQSGGFWGVKKLCAADLQMADLFRHRWMRSLSEQRWLITGDRCYCTQEKMKQS